MFNEVSEINVLNVLLEFEHIVNTNDDCVVEHQLFKELKTFNKYLTTSSIDSKRVWNKKLLKTKMHERNAICKYASKYIAHNSFHKVLFGENKNYNYSYNAYLTMEQIAEMIAQSNLIRDWK